MWLLFVKLMMGGLCLCNNTKRVLKSIKTLERCLKGYDNVMYNMYKVQTFVGKFIWKVYIFQQNYLRGGEQ